MFHNHSGGKSMKKLVIIALALSFAACSIHLPNADPVNQHLGDSAMRLGRLEKAVDSFAQGTSQEIQAIKQAVVELQRQSREAASAKE
jgi:Ni/Co efflux regulator RcnB